MDTCSAIGPFSSDGHLGCMAPWSGPVVVPYPARQWCERIDRYDAYRECLPFRFAFPSGTSGAKCPPQSTWVKKLNALGRLNGLTFGCELMRLVYSRAPLFECTNCNDSTDFLCCTCIELIGILQLGELRHRNWALKCPRQNETILWRSSWVLHD